MHHPWATILLFNLFFLSLVGNQWNLMNKFSKSSRRSKWIPVPITPGAPCRPCPCQAQGHFHRELLEEGLAWSGSQPGAGGKTGTRVPYMWVLEAHGHGVQIYIYIYIYRCDEANIAEAKLYCDIFLIFILYNSMDQWLDQLCFANAPYDHYVLYLYNATI